MRRVLWHKIRFEPYTVLQVMENPLIEVKSYTAGPAPMLTLYDLNGPLLASIFLYCRPGLSGSWLLQK